MSDGSLPVENPVLFRFVWVRNLRDTSFGCAARQVHRQAVALFVTSNGDRARSDRASQFDDRRYDIRNRSTIAETSCATDGRFGDMTDADQNQALWTGIASLLREDEQERLDELRRLADRVSDRIIASDDPPFEIVLEIEKVREKCRELFPDKDDLFDLIYVNRFQRLWEQFRGDEPPF